MMSPSLWSPLNSNSTLNLPLRSTVTIVSPLLSRQVLAGTQPGPVKFRLGVFGFEEFTPSAAAEGPGARAFQGAARAAHVQFTA
jgi:hypothetical protein